MFVEPDTVRPTLRNIGFKSLDIGDIVILEARVTEEEVWRALKNCGSKKAPGLYGFNMGFIKKYWNILKEDLLKAVEYFWHFGCISNGCNSSFFTLIPKSKNSLDLGDYRPINLIGCYYKVISKLLAGRIKQVSGKVVGEEQNAFLEGRFILNGVLITNEVFEHFKKPNKKCMMFKVDFEKAYDSVNWKLLQNTMLQMGFGRRWCQWIETWLKSSKTSVLANGSPTKEFSMERGIRQGDPLTPFLFFIVAEGLNLMLKEAVRNDIFQGIKVGQNKVCLSHL